MHDEAIALGIEPSAAAALSSKFVLALETLNSAQAIVDGLVENSVASLAELAHSKTAIARMKPCLGQAERPGSVVEPVFYEWYFRAIDLLKRKQFAALVPHTRKIPAICAMPLIRAGNLDNNQGGSLAIYVPEDGHLALSERDNVDGPIAINGQSTINLSLDDTNTLVCDDGQTQQRIDWQNLDQHGRFAVPGCPIAFWQTGGAFRRIIADYQRDLSRIHQDVSPFRLVSPAEFAASRYVDRFSAGLAKIEACWPELYAETCVLTDYFTMIHGVPFIGGSAISCLGTSFFKLLPEWSDVCFADHIIHEAAHQRLHVEFELQPAMKNGDFTATISPIRRDPRPLHGVFHASFVFLRLALFMERAVVNDGTAEAERRFHRHLLGLYRGIEQLERHAKWNPRGERFFSLMCEAADRLRTIVVRPDPELYNKLGPDYEPVAALAAAYHD